MLKGGLSSSMTSLSDDSQQQGSVPPWWCSYQSPGEHSSHDGIRASNCFPGMCLQGPVSQKPAPTHGNAPAPTHAAEGGSF